MNISKITKAGKLNSNFYTASTLLIATIGFCLLPELAFAAEADVFKGILTKISGWTGGSAGKLITFCCFLGGALLGMGGFPTKYVLGAFGTGLLLSSAEGLTNMIFN